MMSRHSLVFGVVFGLLSACFSAPAAWAQSDFNGVLDEKAHDFGTVPRGQQLTHYFRIANPTNKTLHITGVRVSCGCTSARALDSTVPPGKETAIYAVMDSRRFSGSKAVTIYVTFDQPRFEELRTVVQAFSREDMAFTPDGLFFGKVRQGEAKSVSMKMTFYNGSVQVTDVHSDSNYILPVAKEVRRAGNETVYEVTATVRPDTPVGLWFSDIWVKTNNQGFAKLRVPVNVEVEGLQPAKSDPNKKIDGTKTSLSPEVVPASQSPQPVVQQPAQQPVEEPAVAQQTPAYQSPQTVPQPAEPRSFSIFNLFRR